MSIKLFTAPEKTVTTAGTRVQVSAVDTIITSLVVQADPGNTGRIYIGDDAVSSTRAAGALVAGQFWTISPDASGRGGQEEYTLSDFWLDGSTSGDKAYISYVKRRI